MKKPFIPALSALMVNGAGKWLVLGSAVGILCGLVGLAFVLASDLLFFFLVNLISGYNPVPPAGEPHLLTAPPGLPFRWWWLVVVIPIGGLISGLLTAKLAPRAAGSGTEAAVEAYHQRQGRLSLRATIVKFWASVAVLGSAGSAGREGPIVMMGAGLGSWLATRLKLSAYDRRILLAAGMSGGIAAVFRTPLAGALFAIEVVYSDSEVEADTMIPCFISAIISFCTFGILSGLFFACDAQADGLLAQLFITEQIPFTATDITHLVGYMALALVIIAAGRLFIAILHKGHSLFDALPMKAWLRPGLGGMLTALLALGLLGLATVSGIGNVNGAGPLAVIGSGYGIIQTLVRGPVPGLHEGLLWPMFCLLTLVGLGKMLTTTCTVTSGGSGGVFGPSIVIGGCLGGAVGLGLHLLPGLQALDFVPPLSACVIMGMAGFITATHKVPITAMLMVSELTGNYLLLLPAMWVCATAFLLSGRASIVETQLTSPLESPAHRGRFFRDILSSITVAEVFDGSTPAETLPPEADLETCQLLVDAQVVGQRHQSVFPVVDAKGRLVGLFNARDLAAYRIGACSGQARHVAIRDCLVITPTDSLAEALARFTITNANELPVVEDDDERRFLGLLSRHLFVSYYNQVVAHVNRYHTAGVNWDTGARPAVVPGQPPVELEWELAEGDPQD